MKLDKQTQTKIVKNRLATANGPFHRLYQHRAWEKNPDKAEQRRGLISLHGGKRDGNRLQPLLQAPQHEVYHRQPNQAAQPLPQNAPELFPTALPISKPNMRSPLRIVWLQQPAQQLPKALALRTRFIDAGMQVNLHQLNWEADAIPEGELILLECIGMFEQEMMRLLLHLRFFSKVPLIILTDNHTLDWSLRALHSGADAIFTVNMPDDVIIARSKALLRRWVSL